MKGVVFTTDEKMYVKDFGEPLYQTLGKEVDGWIEVVHARGLPAPFCFVVNEEGLLKKLPMNTIGSVWYQTRAHGWPIVGNIVVMKDGFTNGEPDIVGLTDEEVQKIMEIARNISDGAIEEVNKSEAENLS